MVCWELLGVCCYLLVVSGMLEVVRGMLEFGRGKGFLLTCYGPPSDCWLLGGATFYGEAKNLLK